MEENKVENIYDSMKYYCRVCTTNTRSKKSRPEESIGIFKRPGLKSILERYLQIQISEDDALPKVICKACFDKIEAIEFLRVIARRTENLLRDFLKNQESQATPNSQFQNEYNSFAISKTTTTPKPDEVIVNVSLSDPLTKNIDKKLLVAQRKKDSLDKAFTPAQINRNAVTSSPNLPAVTIVHQMPRKKTPNALVEKKKSLQMALSNATTVTLEKAPPSAAPATIKLPARTKIATAPPPLRHISDAPTIQQKVEIHPVITGNTHGLSNSITLGSIIKDEDLVRLILKALKWPVNNQTLDIQIQRLKNTKFSDVIVDPNLLQDTDLIQILWPLINPNLVQMPIAPQPPTYHITLPPEPMAIPSTTISYKLPAETSVQIITVPPEENVVPKPRPVPRPMPPMVHPAFRKKPRPSSLPPKKALDVIVVSDESDEESMKELRSNEDVQRFEVQIDPVLYPGIGDNSNSNEAMLATLNRQREAMMRMHRNKRKQSIIGRNMEMVGDITIIDEGVQLSEPYPEVVLVKKPRKIQHMTSVPSPSPSKVIKSPIPLAEPEKSPPMQPILNTFPQLPMMPRKKMPNLIPKSKKPPLPNDLSSLIRLPMKKSTPPASNKPSSSSQYNAKNTTLADADSTTKIVIKETKVPKPLSSQATSSDIEEQISKVRIGKQTQKPVALNKSQKKEKDDASSEKVVIFVEYEGNREEQQKGAEVKDKTEDKATVVESSKAAAKEKDPQGENDMSKETKEKPNEASQGGTSEMAISIELPPIDIKIEPESESSKFDAESTIDDKTSSSEKKGDDDDSESLRSGRALSKSSKDEVKTGNRPGRKRKIEVKKENPKIVATTSYRPARRSKTLSKYYKGPPVADSGRSMRSRT